LVYWFRIGVIEVDIKPFALLMLAMYGIQSFLMLPVDLKRIIVAD